MNKQYHQQGSAHVVIVICLVLALLTALGWIFWQNFIHKEPVQKETEVVTVDKNQDTPSDTLSDTATTEEAYRGLRASSVNKAFSLKVPNGWEVEIDGSSDRIQQNPNSLDTKLAYVESKPPVIKKVKAIYGHGAPVFVVFKSSSKYQSGSDYRRADFTLDNGAKGAKYSAVHVTDANVAPANKRIYSYAYVFTKGDVEVVAQWSRQLELSETIDKNQLKHVEDVVRSIEIK